MLILPFIEGDGTGVDITLVLRKRWMLRGQVLWRPQRDRRGRNLPEMMQRHMGWIEAADLFVKSMERAIDAKIAAYDFARLMPGAPPVSCSAFGQAMIEKM